MRRFFLLATGALPVVTGVAAAGSACRSTDDGACCVTNTGGVGDRAGLVGAEIGGAVVSGCNCNASVTAGAGLGPSVPGAATGITDADAVALAGVIVP